MWRTLGAGGAVLALLGSAAQAADGQGRYNPHGIGRLQCKRFVELCEKASTDCKLTGTWIDGYISALNVQSEDTFDLLSWQDGSVIAELAFHICRQNPDAFLIQAINEVVRQALVPERVRTASQPVRIGEGESAVVMYREAVRAMQQRLADTGHLKGAVDGAFGPGTKAAVESFQRASGLRVTGIPDQVTLATLFYGRPQPQAGAAGQAPAAQAPALPRAAQESRPAAPAPGGGAPLDLNLVPRTN